MEIKNIKVNEYYFHSIIHDVNNTLRTLNSIFSSGSISSPKYRNVSKRSGCNSLDEICLSAQRKIGNAKLYKSCFDLYLPELTTLIIDKEVRKNARIYQPKLVSTDEIFLMFDNNGYTNLYDEYRTKDIIPTDYIKGISIPYDALATDPFLFYKLIDEQALMNCYNGLINYDEVKRMRDDLTNDKEKIKRSKFLDNYISKIKEVLKDNGYDLPIYEYKNKQFKLRG